MKYSDNALNILTAKTFNGIGDAWINKNLSSKKIYPFELIVELLEKNVKKEVVSEDIFLQRKNHIEKQILLLGDSCDGVVAIGDEKFPTYRGTVKESEQPNVLFYKGDLGLLSLENTNVAVIGVLTPDEDTEMDERKIVSHLVQKDAVIVSGLAQGCDFIAHDQTLKFGGATVAILPSPLNNIMPVKHREFSQQIVESGGLLITEYFDSPSTKMELSSRYVKRDRLQALFSDIVILSASYTPNSVDPTALKIDSGSRHAMEKSLEYGIPRAVIYHDKYQQNPKYDLNRQVMQDTKVIVIDPTNPMPMIMQILDLDKRGQPKQMNDDGQMGLFEL
ncbi:DNA-processing protein DprA [Ursidibacter maritimus]|uniref:DNA-processing protein DprA n=1 Tax=Ursidibacter maritimus TaxID=1331689 RepID=A0A949WQN1_9PAST|nr:DNA-processing protein DprA [Ursidibacter maritimus]MBV6524322.1 DNA-processing protein DprA [Ursidibacter maritimus]MBV6526226.1 DNA-processing protein DprA [Ursidibacter maritimus]MBV6528305.1 DNA-processing protein DprA [Ursidibacter maritimus]MBV6529655.1 DNA-processing protein DprA [Ursidibacter maritimus]MBV6531678.1 DNA-processing protein DprA [Ursidibacter maritimus]